MQDYSFAIEAEPVPASRPRVSSRGSTYYPAKHTAYAGFLKETFQNLPDRLPKGPVELRMLFVMPRYKTSDSLTHRADLDNLSKLPMDSMTKSLNEDGTPRFWVDDHLVVHLNTMKRFAREGEKPHTKVRIIPVEGSIEDHADKVFMQ